MSKIMTDEDIKWIEENIAQDNEIRWSEKLKWNGKEFESIPKRAPGEDGEMVEYFCLKCGGYFEEDIIGHMTTCKDVETPIDGKDVYYYLTVPYKIGNSYKLEWVGSDLVKAFAAAKKRNVNVTVMKNLGTVRNVKEESS